MVTLRPTFVAGHEVRPHFIDGAAKRAIEVVCQSCPEKVIIPTGHIGDSGKDRGRDLRYAERALKQEGWKAKPGLRSPSCPKCQEKEASTVTRSPVIDKSRIKVALFSPADPAIGAAKGTQKSAEPSSSALNGRGVAMAEPPPTPTREQKRLIFDALEDGYDIFEGRYIGAATDASLGEVLKVPRAWITEIRREFFGEGGGNEMDGRKVEAVNKGLELCRAQLEEAEAQIEHLLEVTDVIRKNLSTIEEMQRAQLRKP